MGDAPSFDLQSGECALIHTGGMLPNSADAVVMLEYTQTFTTENKKTRGEIEIMRAVAEGENVIRIGEDVADGTVVLPRAE